jgi:GT2 family glycosyltransferase
VNMVVKKGLVSIVIVNWNGISNLKDLFPSLEKVKYKNFEIIIVDHGSTDGSLEYIRKNYPKTKVLAKNKNLGFALGNNVGVREARGEYILLLNNDTLIEPDFLDYLVNAIKNENVGVVQPKIIFADSKKLQSAGTYLTSYGFLYHLGYDKNPEDKKYQKSYEIFSANGSCMLIKHEVIDKVGLFDKDFFLYFEETDFCWRVWLAGYTIKYIPKAVIYHKGGRTAKTLSSTFINFHSFKNRIAAIIKNAGVWELTKTLTLHLILCQGIFLIYLCLFKLKFAFSIQNAIYWNLINFKRTFRKRKLIQKSFRKVSDSLLAPRIKRSIKLSYFYYLFKGLEYYKD